jgi:hypothetical protein
VFAHPLFMTQGEALVEQVEALKKKDPTGYVKKNATKRAYESSEDAYCVCRKIIDQALP